jgi:hypothetical protein
VGGGGEGGGEVYVCAGAGAGVRAVEGKEYTYGGLTLEYKRSARLGCVGAKVARWRAVGTRSKGTILTWA